ncbi:uncharacterized protein BO80DRAFT_460838 [Aspergillus ibericus CBS 121593]|uniref:Uncharacterized protein n=1 Tax=Aspergillus ibericus CBS 121593 TaxID=1448316 RepID=A0A395HD17_9EURO|nr:hypothetical protein BO80DRAFT_460838 [Aspergillus ibericus CBS 121593]RAL05777.1 hypothetical protein BO80DRAFT_460838 [Aspergillus ibericus CBS 121593]
MSTVNLVRFYFLSQPSAQNIRQYIAIAYQTATDQKFYPKAVLVRSGIHLTTSIDGEYQKDPKGEHLTLCFKDEEMMAKGTQVASHGYVALRTDWNIREATHAREKPDSTVMTRNGRPVWPSEEAFQYQIVVAFGHVPDEAEIMSKGN